MTRSSCALVPPNRFCGYANPKNALLGGCLVSGKPRLRLVVGHCRDRSTLPQRFAPARPRRLAFQDAAIVYDALDGAVAFARADFLGVLCSKTVAHSDVLEQFRMMTLVRAPDLCRFSRAAEKPRS